MEVVLPSDIGSDRADGDFPGVGEERSDEKIRKIREAETVETEEYWATLEVRISTLVGKNSKVVSWTRFLVGLIWTFEARK